MYEYSDAKAGQPCVWWKGALPDNAYAHGCLTIRNYPSGEPLIHLPWARDIWISTVMVKPRSMLELMGALFLVDAIKERRQNYAPPCLILPFVPGARQDRLNDEGDSLFTAKSIAKEINQREFKRVTILDPHSDVIAALIDRCEVVRAIDCWRSTDRVYDGILAPDGGAEKRALGFAKAFGVPLFHAWKSRDVSNGAISGFGVELLKGGVRRLLVVDDICDGGGTFVGLQKLLGQMGVEADLYVTHGIFSKGVDSLRYERLYCTDSIDADRPGVTVFPTCKELFEAA